MWHHHFCRLEAIQQIKVILKMAAGIFDSRIEKRKDGHRAKIAGYGVQKISLNLLLSRRRINECSRNELRWIYCVQFYGV